MVGARGGNVDFLGEDDLFFGRLGGVEILGLFLGVVEGEVGRVGEGLLSEGNRSGDLNEHFTGELRQLAPPHM
ncbi:hypothetical protein D3C87_2178140 [compost metagenome]